MKNIAIVGASVGGLVAAAELRERGFGVTVFEASRGVAGMYGRVETPFGIQEMGMHVLYLTEQHYTHLCSIFGDDAFHTWRGPSVDLASHRNFGNNFFNSAYPDLRSHPDMEIIRREVLEGKSRSNQPTNALEAVVNRFGESAARKVYAPILKKLWKTNAELLSPDAIHCFYDLRRTILWDKDETDQIKDDPWFDGVVANPDQRQPRSEVFGGRIAVRFKNLSGDLQQRVDTWLASSGVKMHFGKPAEIRDSRLWIDEEPLDSHFNACIVATPVPTMVPKMLPSMDLLELSIYYFCLEDRIGNNFPAYYIILHEDHLYSSRMVNYDAYNIEDSTTRLPVIAVEVVHPIGQQPAIETIASEVREVFPMVTIVETYLFPSLLKVIVPSLKNGCLITEATVGMENFFEAESLYFTGMRTDKGIFFSHHTIGLAYESALDCARKFA